MGLFGPPNVEKMEAKRDVTGLIKALDYQKDASVRRAAAEALGKLKDARAVVPLIAALEDESTAVRREAAEALGKSGDARAVEPLIVALRDKVTDVRLNAAEALGELKDARAVEPLIAALEDSDNNVCKAAEGALVKIGTPAVEPLIAKLGDRRVRKSAIDVLVKIGTPAVEPLSAALADRDSRVRESAASALDALNWKPVQDKDGVAYWIANEKWDKCIEVGKPAIDPLIALLKDSEWSVRKEAAGALGQIGARLGTDALGGHGVKALIDALEDDVEWVRNAAGEALGKIDWQPGADESGAAYWVARHRWDMCVEIGASAIQPLSAVLNDSRVEVREAAAGALGQICSQLEDTALRARAVSLLITAFKYGNNQAVDALVKIGAPAVSPLIAVLEDEKWLVRQTAAKILVRLYQSGLLNKSHKDLILVHRDSISAKHNDKMEHSFYKNGPSDDDRSYHDEIEHIDNGIGVSFPL